MNIMFPLRPGCFRIGRGFEKYKKDLHNSRPQPQAPGWRVRECAVEPVQIVRGVHHEARSQDCSATSGQITQTHASPGRKNFFLFFKLFLFLGFFQICGLFSWRVWGEREGAPLHARLQQRRKLLLLQDLLKQDALQGGTRHHVQRPVRRCRLRRAGHRQTQGLDTDKHKYPIGSGRLV